jgi:hypothetical protein
MRCYGVGWSHSVQDPILNCCEHTCLTRARKNEVPVLICWSTILWKYLGECILDPGTSWGWVLSLMPWLIYPWRKSPGTHWIGGWVGPRASLDDMENRKFLTLPGFELWLLCRPTRNQSLYHLYYTGSSQLHKMWKNSRLVEWLLVFHWDCAARSELVLWLLLLL